MKKNERLNHELIFLSEKRSFHLSDLMKKFEISKRTALRDLEALSEMGLAYYVENGRYGGYHLLDQKLLTPLLFSSSEIEAILYAVASMKKITYTPFNESFYLISNKLFQHISKAQQCKISKTLEVLDFWQRSPIEYVDNLDMILQSILEEKTLLAINVQKKNRIRLQANRLFYRDGIWFLSGVDLLIQQWGIFRADCLKELTLLDKHTYTIEELDILQKNYEKEYHHIPFKCELSISGVEIFKKHHYPNMKLLDNNIVGGFNPKELDYLTHYLMRFGDQLKIVYPDILKDSYHQLLQRMSSNNT